MGPSLHLVGFRRLRWKGDGFPCLAGGGGRVPTAAVRQDSLGPPLLFGLSISLSPRLCEVSVRAAPEGSKGNLTEAAARLNI